MNYPIGTGSQIMRGPYEEQDDFHRRMESAYERLSLCYYFILVGSRIATPAQVAARDKIQKKLLQLVKYV